MNLQAEIVRLTALVDSKTAYCDALRRQLNSKNAALKQAEQLIDMKDRECCLLLGELEKLAHPMQKTEAP